MTERKKALPTLDALWKSAAANGVNLRLTFATTFDGNREWTIHLEKGDKKVSTSACALPNVHLWDTDKWCSVVDFVQWYIADLVTNV